MKARIWEIHLAERLEFPIVSTGFDSTMDFPSSTSEDYLGLQDNPITVISRLSGISAEGLFVNSSELARIH